jgi:hypothetical protein
MLEEDSHKMYANKFEKRFSSVHWWKILKDEPKWCTHFEETEKNKSEIIDVPDEQARPIGREAAKAERSGKRKKENIMEGIVILGDNIEKIIKVQEDRKVERENVTDAQIQISNTNLKAAMEQKEANMFKVYNSLLNQDINQMSENQKASRDSQTGQHVRLRKNCLVTKVSSDSLSSCSLSELLYVCVNATL